MYRREVLQCSDYGPLLKSFNVPHISQKRLNAFVDHMFWLFNGILPYRCELYENSIWRYCVKSQVTYSCIVVTITMESSFWRNLKICFKTGSQHGYQCHGFEDYISKNVKVCLKQLFTFWFYILWWGVRIPVTYLRFLSPLGRLTISTPLAVSGQLYYLVK